MAGYDPPMMFQVHSGMHPAVLNNVAPRYPHPGPPSGPSTQPAAGSQSRQGPPMPDVKPKAGPNWENTYRTAQNISFPDPKTACGERVGEFVEDLARGIGCPVEYVIVPLLPCVGGLLGSNTTIRVHRAWTEPPIVWSMVGASSGSRRSAVMRQILAPLLSLQAERNKDSTASASDDVITTSLSYVNGFDNTSSDEENEKTIKRGGSSCAPPNRALYSGSNLTLASLSEMLLRNDGHAFSLTENVQNLHEVLGLTQPVISPKLTSVLEDLYEGLPFVAVDNGKVTTSHGSNFNHGGFTSPEYIVTLMVKSPSWLSARLLLSCPQADDMKGVFGEPSTEMEAPELEQIFAILLEQHREKQKYVFSSEAVQELSKFFEEEWSTVLNQLDQNEHEGIIGKSMGQIVRLCGILKALDNSILIAGSSQARFIDWDWTIKADTVSNAITLGKYFLEQKLAMTFMVATGFFSHASESFMDNSINDSNNQATTLPQTALQDSQDDFRSNSFSSSKPSVSHTASALPPAVTRSSQDLSSSTSSQQAPNASFNLPKQPGDVDFNNLPHTMTTVEEDVSEMMQALDFVHFSKTQFVAVHGRRIKRLLECYDDGHGVSATTAAQKSITPPVRIEGTNNRHPAWASALFFQKVAELELGTAEQGRHPTNRKVCWRFKRKPVSQLSEKDFQLLYYLRVEMEKYSQFGSGSFNPSLIVNSGLITLPPSNSPGPHTQSSTLGADSSPRLGSLDDDSNSQSSPQNLGTPNVKNEVF